MVFDVGEYAGQPALETLTVEDLGGRTKITNRSQFPSSEVLDQALATGMAQGAIETYDRLAELLITLKARR